jgi:hypothetical protein
MSKPEKPPTVRDLKREIEAATILREQIATLAQGDEDFIRDVIEGETDLREIIAALVADDAADDAMIGGIKAMLTKLKARADRVEARIEYRRALIASGLDIAGLPKLETPAGTVRIKPVGPKAVITDESAIPARFWKPSDPKLDRTALNIALKEGQTVPGASLNNGSSTLEIRRS